MTGEMEKNRKQKLLGTDESSSGICRVGVRKTNESNNSSSCHTPNSARLTTRNGEDQPLFKKPRLDVSFVMLPEFQYDDGSIILKNCDSLKTDDGNKGQDCSAECVGECSTCGDTGFQSELFRCTRCSVRLQHTYCSNSYNPRKRWFIGLCNWCEMDVARTATPGGSSKQAVAIPNNMHNHNTQAGGLLSNRRDSSNNSPWLEKRNAVDCLLGAALRLPSAGLSNMEELLPHSTRAAKGRKSPSFDTVEKAKRSGPSCHSAVKTINKRSPGSLSSSGSIGSEGKVLQTSTGGDGCVHKDEKPSLLKRSHSHLQYSKAAAAAAGGGNTDGKENLKDTTTSNVNSAEKRVAARSGGGSESEKLSTGTTAAKRSPSATVTKSRKSPVGDYDDKSETTVDNTVRTSLRRSPSRCTNGGAAVSGAEDVKSEDGHDDEERKVKEGICRIAGERSKPAGLQDSPSCETTSIRRSRDHKENGGSSARTGGAASADARVERRSPVHSDHSSAGGSDCSNVTEVQRNGNHHHHGHGISSSRDTPLRKSHSFKQQQQARLIRPTVIIGKSKSHAMETPKTPKRFSDLKDSKLRRSSNSPRVSGAHFKCLSDILC